MWFQWVFIANANQIVSHFYEIGDVKSKMSAADGYFIMKDSLIDGKKIPERVLYYI